MRLSSRYFAATALIATLSAASPALAQREFQSLAGSWRFLLNGPKPGATQTARPELALNDTIALPGTTDTRKKGPVSAPGWNGALTRVHKFEGAAWYEREITVPANWAKKRVTLFLERTKYSQLWLDGQPLGENPLITAPHEYVLGQLAPGAHRITLAIDNSRKPVPGDMHQMSDNTQGNWNGIIGALELRATDAVWLEDVQVYPDAATKTARVKIKLGNSSGAAGAGFLRVGVKGQGVSPRSDAPLLVNWTAQGGAAEYNIPLDRNAALWDEFHPSLHALTVKLDVPGLRGFTARDSQTVTFGLRNFSTRGSQFAVNGRTTFLRGRHDACVFPLTGHPPMDVAGWTRYFRIVKSWGLNHVRFHTWTPPEAAFTAADQIGVYLQPELPFWGDFREDIKVALKPEGEAILRRFGNHPSFVMFALGNENRFSREIMGSLESELRALDPRHLYAQGSNNFAWDPQLPAGDDYLISARAKNSPQSLSRNVRGSHAGSDGANAPVQAGPPSTLADYSEAIGGIPRPVVGHEIGQYTVYPNFREISKYTGAMRAHNLEFFQKKLADAGMSDQADDFFRASGELSALCYREEIELAVRTPGFGGFQLLDLQDFPGQGTALVGMLDAFMDSKGLISPEKWREFCAPVTLHARFPKYTYTSGERFTARVQVAHYGEKDLPRAVLTWNLREVGAKKPLASGKSRAVPLAQGGLRDLAEISTTLAVSKPTRFNLELQLAGSDVKTSYPIWVYPAAAPVQAPANVSLVQSLDANARQTLQNGGRVLLVTDGKKPLAHTVGGGFTTDFWNFSMFHNKPGTMGLLMDSQNPALANFPTENRTNWQWFDLAYNSQPLVLDSLPRGYRPLVQVVDNMDRVHRLGLVFELKVGAGRLLVCATDLMAMQNKPEARQLLSSLMSYAASEKFDPQTEVSMPQLREMLLTTLPIRGKASASSTSDGWQQQRPEKVIDGNDYTDWLSARGASGEQWWRVDFDSPQDLSGAEILWGEERAGYRYIVEGTSDGTTWQTLSDQKNNAFAGGTHKLTLSATGIRAVRLTVSGLPERTNAGLREVRFFGPE